MANSVLLPLIASLPAWHRDALTWFDTHAGTITGWPGMLPNGTFLASKAKGIYKPKDSQYALSIRQSLSSVYPDRAIERHPDGTWVFDYFQESLDTDGTTTQFTNRGLLECLKDVIPVGVFLQVRPKPKPQYLIVGLALVAGFTNGYFRLEGADSQALQYIAPRSGQPSIRADYVAGAFMLDKIEDERSRTLRVITERKGQPGFRATLLDAYGGSCAITGYDAREALEAAHIVPYRGPVTNHPSNGLLLRADIHTLFDLGLMSIEHATRRVLVANDLKSTKYDALRDTSARFPEESRLSPSAEALAWHVAQARV